MRRRTRWTWISRFSLPARSTANGAEKANLMMVDIIVEGLEAYRYVEE